MPAALPPSPSTVPPTSIGSSATTRDGLTLHTRSWTAPDPWATMVLVHGLGEHAGRYEHVGAHFVASGIEVFAYDQRGFGQSEGTRAYVDSFSQFLDDLEDRIAAVRTEGRPLIVLGHSMGGLVVAAYAVSDRPAVDAVVLSAPALGADVPKWQRVASRLLHRVSPKLSVPGNIDPVSLSHDVEVQHDYRDDPLVEKNTTVNLGHEMFSAMQDTTAALHRLTTPTLVVHGTADSLVAARFSAPLGPLPNVRRELYPRLRHELFNEPEYPRVLADITTWLTATMGENQS